MISSDQLASNGGSGVGGVILPGLNILGDGIRPSEVDAVERLDRFVSPDATRAPLLDLLRWADDLLDRLHKLHIQSPPFIRGDISPAGIGVDAKSGAVYFRGSSTDANSVNYQPLEQIWEGLDPISQRVILDRYDDQTEKWLSKPLSVGSDIYSVAATIYAVATGIIPPDALDRSIAEIEGKPDPLRPAAEIDPTIPTDISEAILKAMSLHREERYYSAVIFRHVLAAAATKLKERDPALTMVDPDAGPILDLSTPPPPDPPRQQVPVEFDTAKARELAQRILAAKAAERSSAALSSEAEILNVPAVEAHPIVETQPAASPVRDTVTEPAESKNSRGRFIAIATASLAILAAAGVGAYQSTRTSEQLPAPAEVPAVMQVAADPVTTLPATVAEQPADAATEPVAADIERPKTVVRDPGVDKPARSAIPADKAKKPAVPPAKPAPAKKALTVDDLINDH